MSLLRNILIVGLLACVAYNGYLIYRNHTSVAQAEPEEELSDAPLFNADAFTALAGNRSQVSVQQAPTIVLPNEELPSAQPVSNPVLVTSTEPRENVAPVSAESADLGSDNHVSSDPVEIDSPAEAPEEVLIEAGTSRFTAAGSATDSATRQTVVQEEAVVSFDDAWKEIEAATAEFRLADALRLLDDLARRPELSAEQHAQVTRKGDELAKTVIYASHKHLALPAHTFLPGSTLEEVADQHALPLSFLRDINGWPETEGPTPGDSIKVLQGPISLHVDLPRSGILVSIGDLYGRWIAIDAKQLPTPTESSLKLQQGDEPTQLSIGDTAIVATDAEQSQSSNFIAVASHAWDQLSKLAAASPSVSWSPETIPSADVAEAPVGPEAASDGLPQPTERPQVVMQPVDALKLEVFTPVGKTIQGELVRYGLQVSNLSERDSDLVQVVVNLSEGVEPTQVEGHSGRVEVGQAIFDPLTIPAGESVRLTVVIDTLQPGNHVVRPELQCAQPATRYATEVQLQVAAAESVSAEPQSDKMPSNETQAVEAASTESPSAESPGQESATSQSGSALAERPQNPARKTR